LTVAHVLELLALLLGQELFELGVHVLLNPLQFLLLIVGQLELVLGVGRKDGPRRRAAAEAAEPATGAAGETAGSAEAAARTEAPRATAAAAHRARPGPARPRERPSRQLLVGRLLLVAEPLDRFGRALFREGPELLPHSGVDPPDPAKSTSPTATRPPAAP